MSLLFEKDAAGLRVLVDEDLDLLSCHQLNPERYPFFLESHSQASAQSRFDILFAFPGEKIEANSLNNNFFDELESELDSINLSTPTQADLPFRSGWFVYLSYELVASIEPKLSGINVDTQLPIALAVSMPAAIIKDHKENKSWLVGSHDSENLLNEIYLDILSCADEQVEPRHCKETSWAAIRQEPAKEFLSSVEKVQHYLKEGDTFQVNLSRRYVGKLDSKIDYLDVYRSLRKQNPAPFSGLACIGESVICSASPERLVRSKGNVVEMRPIAGTRPRGANSVEDQALSEELLANQKENAEHIMLLDLIRNDLGRICEAGTIKLDESMLIESYATVHHIVSNICGKLQTGVKATDIIRAVFPGGTITGCPKVRCMEIIHELEKSPRGAYTGSMGYINYNGDLDLNILIRTMVIEDKKVNFRTGAGIVSDSVVEDELAETMHKAKGMYRTLNIHES
ncbi:MAG: anthranilate synthase [Cycloclasticus sp. symbiont of Poecilosclerida sp. M]|nr:MAG: anthranilate synthase [Cycloclasticus sp. symbiont of Poecilosclerida sp. M]